MEQGHERKDRNTDPLQLQLSIIRKSFQCTRDIGQAPSWPWPTAQDDCTHRLLLTQGEVPSLGGGETSQGHGAHLNIRTVNKNVSYCVRIPARGIRMNNIGKWEKPTQKKVSACFRKRYRRGMIVELVPFKKNRK